MKPFHWFLGVSVALGVFLFFLINPAMMTGAAAKDIHHLDPMKIGLTQGKMQWTQNFAYLDPCSYPYPYPYFDPIPTLYPAYPAYPAGMQRSKSSMTADALEISDLYPFNGWQAGWQDAEDPSVYDYAEEIACDAAQSSGPAWIRDSDVFRLGINSENLEDGSANPWKDGAIAWGFVNRTGQTLTHATIRYYAYLPPEAREDSIHVAYRVGKNISLFSEGNWTEIEALTFSGEAENGFVTADLPIYIAPGDELVLRWKAGSENTGHLFGIDEAYLKVTTGVAVESLRVVDEDLNPLSDTQVYHTADWLRLAVTYEKEVYYKGRNLPYIRLTVGDREDERAIYLQGTGTQAQPMIFAYIFPRDVYDEDGIEIDPQITLPEGTGLYVYQTDLDQDPEAVDLNLPLDLIPTVKVVQDAGQVTLAEPPNGQTQFLRGDDLFFTVHLSRVVIAGGMPQLPWKLGDTQRYASFYSGNFTDTLTFHDVVLPGDFTDEGIQLGDQLIEQDGLIYPPPHEHGIDLSIQGDAALSEVHIDGRVQPESASIPSGRYKAGAMVPITVVYDHNLILEPASARPTLHFLFGASEDEELRSADFDKLVNANSLTFNYLVQEGDLDVDGMSISDLTLPDGQRLLDEHGVEVNQQIHLVIPAAGIVVDGVAPEIGQVDLPVAGSYSQGAVLQFSVKWNEAVSIHGAPRLGVWVGETRRWAAGTPDAAGGGIDFRYTVQSGDLGEVRLDETVSLNGGSIQDLAGNPAVLEIKTQPSGVKVDGRLPDVTAHSAGADELDVPLDANLSLTFNMPVTVSEGWFALTCERSGSHAIHETHQGLTYTLDPAANFVNGEACTARVYKNAVSNSIGKHPAQDIEWSFITHIQTPAPLIDLPVNTAEGVNRTRSFTVRFPTPVVFRSSGSAAANATEKEGNQSNEENDDWLTLTCSDSGERAYTTSVSADGLDYTIQPVEPLLAGEQCTLTVHADRVFARSDGARVIANDMTVQFRAAEEMSIYLPAVLRRQE